jgi:hypothetical protein
LLLKRQASCLWLNSLADLKVAQDDCIPCLSDEEHAAIARQLIERETFQPWTHHLVETISTLPYIKRRFPYQEYIQKVGRLEADGWLVRVYVNHESCE